jgi:hypothetical protein
MQRIAEHKTRILRDRDRWRLETLLRVVAPNIVVTTNYDLVSMQCPRAS